MRSVITIFLVCLLLANCSGRKNKVDEQIRIQTGTDAEATTDTVNAIRGNKSLAQLATYPSNVILTGMAQHRLVPVYKTRVENEDDNRGFFSKRYYYDAESDRYQHYMPGVDLLFGYNLLNIAHYDLSTEQMNFLFDHPVLIKSLYYPSYEQDSINKKPINRNYYLVSAYDEDTNRDTLINRTDLRRFFTFDSSGDNRMQIIPSDYSVERSQYDAMNDLMYIFARQDSNKNGKAEENEPLHIFWINLKNPEKAKRLY